MINTITISSKNQITIPAKIMNLWGVDKKNRQIIWEMVDRGKDKLLIIKPKPNNMVNEFAGIAEGLFGKNSEKHLKRERASWD